jgi:hypothetical protein
MIVRSILFGIAKLAGALVLLGFSLGVTGGGKLKADSSASREDEELKTQDTVEDMTKAIENAAKQVIKDLEERTMVAVRLLDEAEEKIARLKGMLDVQIKGMPDACGEHVLGEAIFPEMTSEEQAQEGQSSVCEETGQELSVPQASETVVPVEKSPNKKHALVCQLAGEGLSLQEIAEKAGIGCGEVELILNLRGIGD